jgi:hypothetical protein
MNSYHVPIRQVEIVATTGMALVLADSPEEALYKANTDAIEGYYEGKEESREVSSTEAIGSPEEL